MFASESASADQVVTTETRTPHGTRVTTTTTRHASEAPSANVGYLPSPSNSPLTSPRSTSSIGKLSSLFDESTVASDGSDYEAAARGRY